MWTRCSGMDRTGWTARFQAGAAVCVGVVAACQGEAPAPDAANFGVQVAALAGPCGNSAEKNPFADIKTLQVVVRDREPGKESKTPMVPPVSLPLGSGQKAITVPNIPAGVREVTLLGYGAGTGPATWFGRHRSVKVAKTATSDIHLSIMNLEGFSCVSQATMPNVMFPAAVPISNGKILITGGFGHTGDDPGGKDLVLESPKDTAYLYDPALGQLTQLTPRMKAARAGHAMVYLVKLNKVLIVGGAAKMLVRADGSEPPRWKPEDAVNEPFEVFDVVKEKFDLAPGKEFVRKRVLPNLMTLSDDSVVVMGGAPWPQIDDPAYQQSDLFTPRAGGFEDTKGALPLNLSRTGAGVAFMGQTAVGTRKYMIWAGNAARPGDGKNTPIAERFKESTDQGQGEFFGDFTIEGDYPVAQSLFFPSLVSLGVTRDAKGTALDDGRFLSVGGIRHDGTKWLAPSKDDVYLLTVKEKTDTAKARIATKRVAKLMGGIYLHQAVAAGPDHVMILGGFSSFDQPASFGVQAFESASGALLDASLTPATKQFVARGALAAVALSNDCVLGFGGTDTWSAMKQNTQVVADIYCPRLLVPPLK
ncbi:MAG: hypothetical protein EXR79_06030 [Myxococcales bacterium]|nr:hypothetical protein [Myxococcales bacterium]